jgi:hypothetical protein
MALIELWTGPKPNRCRASAASALGFVVMVSLRRFQLPASPHERAEKWHRLGQRAVKGNVSTNELLSAWTGTGIARLRCVAPHAHAVRTWLADANAALEK